MSFEDRLKKAIQRGRNRNEASQAAEQAKALTEEEFKRLHSQARLTLSDHIEECIRTVSQQFPGFQQETVYGEKGWGAACTRDDIRMERGNRTNLYSRLEMTVRPHSSANVIDLAAKGTIHNREVFNRSYYEQLPDIDEAKFLELIDVWALEYAEMFAAVD